MNDMDIRKFISIIEEKKQINTEEPVIEYTHIGEDLFEITKNLEETEAGNVKWNWNYTKNIKDTGYLNGEPFVIFPSSSTKKNGVLAFKNRFIEFHGNNNYCYRELEKDENGVISKISKSGVHSARFNIVHDNGENFFCYTEDINSEYGKEPKFSYNDYYARELHETLKKANLVPYDENSKNCLTIFSEFGVTNKENDNFAICYAKYPNIDYYNEDYLPYLIEYRVKEKNVEVAFGHFILLNDGRYVDVNRYLNNGFEGSVISIDEIQTELQKYNLTLRISDRLNEVLLSDGLGSKEVTQLLSGGRNL